MFVNKDPAHPNEAYFQHVDYVVNEAESLGLYVALVPIWCKEYVNEKGSVLTRETAFSYGAGDGFEIGAAAGEKNPEAEGPIFRREFQFFPQGLKPALLFIALAARLKSSPDTSRRRERILPQCTHPCPGTSTFRQTHVYCTRRSPLTTRPIR